MKTIKVVTKRQAERAMIDTLFHGKRTATTKMRYDRGKYTGKASDYYGREIEALDNVAAIWPENRKDKNGAYVSFWCWAM